MTHKNLSNKAKGSSQFVAKRVMRWGIYLALSITTLLTLAPLLWMVSTSLRPSSESYKLPPQWLPTDFRIENYQAVFDSSLPFLRLIWNTLKITVAVTLGQLLLCSMAGFAFAKLRFPGREILFIVLLASLMVPNQVTVIPIFLIMRTFGLIDTHMSLILPGLVSAFGVFLMRQFFMALPSELIAAAKIDGAGTWTIFTRIALPLAVPALVTLSILTFNTTWNAYFYPLIFLSSWDKMTLPQGIAQLQGTMQSGNPSVIMAAVTMALLPVLFIFVLAQRWIVEAFAQSGLK